MEQRLRQQLKSSLYSQFARMGKAFGNARRLEIIDLLSQAEHTVEDLAHKMGLSIASVSQHLQVLRTAELVEVTRRGTYAHYRLSDARVFDIWTLMRELAQDRISEINDFIRQYCEERDTLDTIDALELLRRLEAGTITIIDARPIDEYQSGHIPTALSIPRERLESFLKSHPENSEIVAYCRASYCLLSDEVALYLREQGCDVRIFQDGFPKWQADGHPVETSADVSSRG